MGGAFHKYDGEGHRIQQTVGANVTRYLLDVQPGLVVVLGATTGANTEHYVHAPRAPQAGFPSVSIHARKDSSSAWHWAVQDALGSVRLEASSVAAVEGSRNLDSYGNLIGSVNGTIGTPYHFTGEILDGSSLLDLRARRYASAWGIFTSLDPFEGTPDRPMSLNGYSYVEGNPINVTDPSGQFAPAVAIGIGVLVVGAIILALEAINRAYRNPSLIEAGAEALERLCAPVFKEVSDIVEEFLDPDRVNDPDPDPEEEPERRHFPDPPLDSSSQGTVVVLGAGGSESAYTPPPVGLIAPISQLAAVMRSFPGWKVFSVDLGAGGIKESLSGNISNAVVRAAKLYGYDISIPDNSIGLLQEIASSYQDFILPGYKADVVISFYPDGHEIHDIVPTANRILKSYGRFYTISDINDFIKSIRNDLLNGGWSVPNLMPGGYSNPRTANVGIIHSGSNPFGLRGFATLQYPLGSVDGVAYDIFAVKL